MTDIVRLITELEPNLFAFLCRKYVQRADARQQGMGLQYTEAETHDLAREVARWIAAQLRADHPAGGAENATGWTCFHCGETFTTEIDAHNHFGSHEGATAACQIKAAGEFEILRALRNAEDQLDRYRAEDSDVLRAMAAMQADHKAALRQAEEAGYTRGLRDAKLPADAPVAPSPEAATAPLPPTSESDRR